MNETKSAGMHVVNISLDPKILDPETPAAQRVKAYGSVVETYSVVVPTPATMTVKISDSATVYGISGSNKIFQLYAMYQKIVALVKEGKCDVIASADMYYLGLVALFIARKYHLGLEINVLGIEKLSSLRKKTAVYVLKNASTVRALSRRLEGRLREEFGIPKEQMRVIPIHVPVDTLGLDVRSLDERESRVFDIARADFKKQYGAYVNFLSVSRLVPIKRIERQIAALAEMVKEHQNVRLHVVGDGPSDAFLKSEVEKHNLSEYVIFHGRKTGFELGVFYFECDCFLLTSDYEGWGMVIVEAATAGLPVIMTDVGCAGEFIIDGESGIVVPVGDGRALKDAMVRICTDKELRQSLSLGTKTALASLESFEAILSQYKKNWELALNNKL